MDVGIAASVMATKQSATQQTAAMKIMKKEHDMQTALIDMIDTAVRSAPQPGQGTQVDKLV